MRTGVAMMDLDRARRAQVLLSDTDAQAALTDIETASIARWRDAKTTDAREAAWHEINALTQFRAKLKTYASDLSFAQKGDGR